MLVEYAIVLIPTILLTLGAVDFGFMIWDTNQVNRAVNAVARCIAIGPPLCVNQCASIQTYGSRLAYTTYPVTFTSTALNSAGCSQQITGTMTYHYLFLPFSAKNISVSACYPSQTLLQNLC